MMVLCSGVSGQGVEKVWNTKCILVSGDSLVPGLGGRSVIVQCNILYK